MSFILCISSDNLSIPPPNAIPVYLLVSILQFFKTFSCIIPPPITSSHPDCLHIEQPLLLQIKHSMSISRLGDVKGKYDGRNLSFKFF